MASSLAAPRHVLQWTSKFTREPVNRGLGGEVYALSEMVDPVASIRDFYESSAGLSPGVLGLGGCKGPLTCSQTKVAITEK